MDFDSIAARIRRGDNLTPVELARFTWEGPAKMIAEIYGDEHRWQKEVTYILRHGDTLFAVECMRGLTERQEDDYVQAYEVTESVERALELVKTPVFTPVRSDVCPGKAFYNTGGKISAGVSRAIIARPENLVKALSAVLGAAEDLRPLPETLNNAGLDDKETEEFFDCMNALGVSIPGVF